MSAVRQPPAGSLACRPFFRRPRLRFIVTIAVLGAIGLAVGAVGEALSRPSLHPVGAAPVGLAVGPVSLRTTTGAPVAGWLVRGRPGGGAVLLLHGVRGDRREMIGRAEFLQRGYAVLLIDLPGHGESNAEHITYGAGESAGVTAALAYLHATLPQERIGVIGVSLGAASLVLARPDPAPQAVVLESMFPTLADAVADRLELHVGRWARPLAPLLLWQLPLRLGVAAERLRPIDALSALRAPLLVVSGSADRHTHLEETEQLYAAAQVPKQLWIVDGAAHVDLHAYAPSAYEAKIGAFLAQNLRGGA